MRILLTNIHQRAQRAQNTVEFALLMPIIGLMFIGVFDLSRAFWMYNDVSNAVREGARYGTYDSNTDNIKAVTLATTTSGLTAAQITVTCYQGFTNATRNCASVTFGDGIKVSAAAVYQPATGVLIQVLGSSIPITASSMRSFQ